MTGDLSGLKSLPPDLIFGADKNEYIRGTYRKANIITNGDNDVILAGAGGGLINTGIGQNDVVFLPSANNQTDAGTTLVVSPGLTTVVGGGPNDKLVILADRLSPSSGSAPAATNTSDTIQLQGAGGPAYDPSSKGTLYENHFTGKYNYFVDYNQVGSDLMITVRSNSPDFDPSKGWNGGFVIKNFHNGDFGITLGGSAVAEAGAQPSSYTDDDASVVWTGQNPAGPAFYMYGQQSNALSASTLSADLTAVVANTQGGNTTLVGSSPPVVGDLTLSNSDVTGSIAGGHTATVTGNRDTITATGNGATIDFGGTGEAASISSGAVALWDGASATVTGNSNTVTLNANGAVVVTGTGNTVNVAAAGNTVTTSGATINLWNNAGASISGNTDVVNLNASNTLTMSGTGDKVLVASTGNTITMGAGEVDLWNNAGATVSGNGDTFVLYDATTLTASGSGAMVNVAGKGAKVSTTSANVAFYNGASGTVAGAGNNLVLNSNDTVTATGTAIGVTIQGTGDALTVQSAHVGLSAGSAATVTGNGESFSFFGGSSLKVSGTGESFIFAAHPSTATIGGYDASDTFQFSASTFTNWQALLSHASQSGADTVIHVDTANTLTLTNVTLASLNQTHFKFV